MKQTYGIIERLDSFLCIVDCIQDAFVEYKHYTSVRESKTDIT